MREKTTEQIIKRRVRQRLARAKQIRTKYYHEEKDFPIIKIDYNGIIEKLKPFPEDISQIQIDHIIPIAEFYIYNKEELELAFSPENLQWLPQKENNKKMCDCDKRIKLYRKLKGLRFRRKK